MHHSWSEGADRFGYQWLPGNVRFRKRECQALDKVSYGLGGLVVRVLMSAALWASGNPGAAAVFFVLDMLLSVRRPHFVDVGRFTVGVFLAVPRSNCEPFFSIGFTRHGPDAGAPANGLSIGFGRVVLMACTLLPRAEWKVFRAEQAERRAQRKGPRRALRVRRRLRRLVVAGPRSLRVGSWMLWSGRMPGTTIGVGQITVADKPSDLRLTRTEDWRGHTVVLFGRAFAVLRSRPVEVRQLRT
ncbi:hypothetical protein [Streptomyces sp. BK022]|uniref:hypothetical protein n=1 Tax=Streptomyces sp. BK022 TaxID=2512123 RepID=UPI001029F1C2|nr:hypothetical protein [Streptomyces sp. BK022]